MILRYKEGNNQNVTPSYITYAAVMDAYARQGDIEGTLSIWKLMEDDYQSGNKSAKANAQAYSILIDAWSKSGKNDAPVEMEKILKEMSQNFQTGELQEGPNVITYTSMIRCLKKFEGTEERVQELIVESRKDFEF